MQDSSAAFDLLPRVTPPLARQSFVAKVNLLFSKSGYHGSAKRITVVATSKADVEQYRS